MFKKKIFIVLKKCTCIVLCTRTSKYFECHAISPNVRKCIMIYASYLMCCYFYFFAEAVPQAIYNELPRQLQELTSIDKTRPGDIIQIGRRRIGDFPVASGPQMHADQPQEEEAEPKHWELFLPLNLHTSSLCPFVPFSCQTYKLAWSAVFVIKLFE